MIEIQNIPVTLRTFLNQLKTFLEKVDAKEDTTKTTISRVKQFYNQLEQNSINTFMKRTISRTSSHLLS